MKWNREVLVVFTRLLLTRGKRGGGSDRYEVPAKRAGLLLVCAQIYKFVAVNDGCEVQAERAG